MKKRWIGPVLIVLMVAFSLAVYGRLPERVPTHFDLSGQPDDWMDRFPGAFVLPALTAGIYLLLLALRRIDPRRAHYARFEDTYWVILAVLAIILSALHVLTLGLALGWPIDMGRATMMTMGLLFVGLGNYLPRIRSNWWIGIRTPWTLENETVWRDTHRVGGWTFVAAGLVLVAAGLLLPAGPREWVGGIALAVGVVVPFVYSYLAWRRVLAEGGEGAEAR